MADHHKIFYTAQTQVVLDTIEKDGLYKVKKEFIDKKYGSVAPIMHQAYSWFSLKLEKDISKPSGCDYPIWLFKQAEYARVDESQTLLKLVVPVDEVVCFDNHGWERVLSMSYVGKTVTEENHYDDKLKTMGIQGGHQAFQQPFYPIQKQEIMKSWDRIFQLESHSNVRGAIWYLKKEWIIE